METPLEVYFFFNSTIQTIQFFVPNKFHSILFVMSAKLYRCRYECFLYSRNQDLDVKPEKSSPIRNLWKTQNSNIKNWTTDIEPQVSNNCETKCRAYFCRTTFHNKNIDAGQNLFVRMQTVYENKQMKCAH